MKKGILTATLLLSSLVLGSAGASERLDHFKGHPSEDIEQAAKNFLDYNQRLAVLVERDRLSAVDLSTVHELTYTLENALERMKEDLEALAEALEEAHVASEAGNYDATLAKARAYLEKAGLITQ
ncbi:MAG: DUF6746 family protein [Chromatocurvus sp.]